MPHASVLFQVNASMCCALGSATEFDGVTDALVIAGTFVTIRDVSGDVVLQTMVTTTQERTVLAEQIKQEYAENACIPIMCVQLEWTQSMRIQRPAGFELGQSLLRMEARVNLIPIPGDIDFEYFVPDTCFICYEAAEMLTII